MRFRRYVVEAGTGNHDLELSDTDLMLGLYAQWIRPGAELLMQRGEVSFLAPSGPPTFVTEVQEDINATDPKALSGLNLRLSLFGFLQLDGKYSLTVSIHGPLF